MTSNTIFRCFLLLILFGATFAVTGLVLTVMDMNSQTKRINAESAREAAHP